MKYIFGLIILPALVFNTSLAQENQPFALIELYTSQGCSSCPRADQYLSEIIDKSAIEGKKIIALSFHVDYWNRLGWKDPFSTEANTQRQYAYAQSMRSSNVYTPQMVVNGQVEFVGSNRQKGGWAIQNALQKQPNTSIEISDLTTTADQVKLSYEVTGSSTRGSMNFAVVERDISTSVGRGENRGRTLHHDNVVRVFKSIPLNQQKGDFTLELPNDLDKSKSAVVAFIQKDGLKEIEAAEIVELD